MKPFPLGAFTSNETAKWETILTRKVNHVWYSLWQVCLCRVCQLIFLWWTLTFSFISVVHSGPGWNVTEDKRETSDVFRRSPAFPVHHSLCLTFSQLTCRLYKTGVLKSDDGDGWGEKEKKGKWELKSVFLVDTEADSASISRGAVYSANSRQKRDSIKCMIIIVHKCEKLRNPVTAERDSVRWQSEKKGLWREFKWATIWVRRDEEWMRQDGIQGQRKRVWRVQKSGKSDPRRFVVESN